MVGRDMPLEGKVVVVTGASRGIGRAIAERLGAAGAEIVAAARTLTADDDRGSASETAELIRRRGGKAVAMTVDLESPASREALIAGVIDRLRRIDILVNNAGTAAYIKTDEMPLATAESQIDTYFTGPWHLCHLVLPHMKAQRRGQILNIGSCAVLPPTLPYDAYNAARGNETLYAACKAAAHRLATGLAAEVHADNIAVNVVAPVGAIYTPGLASLGLAITPDMEIFEPIEDIAEAALDILSRPIDYTGQVEYSYQFLDRIGRSTRSLDGTKLLKQRSPVEAVGA
jgi:NAD(P)-dependent dehydrogenase (short-subunit alcohol dehydrogenase family)